MQVGLASIPSVENDLLPLGDVTLAPMGLTGVSEAQLARAMAERVLASATDPQALASVRAVFADSPLAFRLGALAALMRRR